MSVHVAILLPRYLRLILSGQKTIESRLTKTSREPYGAIEVGQRIFFKASSGPYMATAVAGKVKFYSNLNPAAVRAMKAEHNDAICGDDDYWQWKADSNYATLIRLNDVSPISVGPNMPPSRGIAWFVLPDAAAPAVFTIALTAGAIRNRYVRIPLKSHRFPPACYGGKTSSEAGRAITFDLPDGEVVYSDLLPNGMIRSRQWSSFFSTIKAKAGDRLCFVQLEKHRYGVSVQKN